MTPILGILVGGQSARMGRPKALLEVDGSTVLERTFAAASQITTRIILLGSPSFELPTLVRSLPSLPDLHPGLGPIGGLETLLGRHPGEAGLLVACDMPYLTSELLLRLLDAPAGHDAAVCVTGGPELPRRHPCCACYRTQAAAAVKAMISAGRFAMNELLDRLMVWPVHLQGEQARWVENWNQPDDVLRAR